MKLWCIPLTIGFWGLLILDGFSVSLSFFIFLSIYICLQYKNKVPMILWIFLFIISFFTNTIKTPSFPKKGIYKVYEIHNKYCLASDGSNKVVVYGIDDAGMDDMYFLNNFKEIRGNKNIGLFDYPEYMHKKEIYYQSQCSNKNLKKKGEGIRALLYRKVKDTDCLQWCKAILYGFQQDSSLDFIMKLGLPFLGIVSWLRIRLYRFFSKQKAEVILIFFSILSGYFFVYPISLCRYILFMLGKIITDDWRCQWSISCMIFMILFPRYVADFVFIFPALFVLIYHLSDGIVERHILGKVVLFVMQLIYFGQIDLIQLFCFGIIRKVYSVSYLLALFSLIFPMLSNIFFKIYEALIKFLSHIPHLNWEFQFSFLFLLLAIYVIAYILIHHKMTIVFVILLIFPFVSPFCSPFFHVYMFDIGQGDCSLIIEPFHKSSVLIDCGQNLYKDNIEDIVYPFLKKNHITNLDAVIITHDDFDHSGGLKRLNDLISINKIIKKDTETINVKYPFRFLLPNRMAKDENDKSIVSYFSYDGFNYLWTGDASKDVEQQIIDKYNLDVDVLKLGHHGSNTSSDFLFLDNLRPKVSLISVGEKNRYNHPSNSVIESLSTLGLDVLLTSHEGMIDIFSWRGMLFFRTASGLFGIIH